MNLFALQTIATFNRAIFETLLFEMLHRLDFPTGTGANSGRLCQHEQQLYLPKSLLPEENFSWKARCHLIASMVTEGEVDGVVLEALLVTDLQGTILFGNQGVEQLWQTSINDLLGKTLADVEIETLRDPLSREILNVLRLSKQDAGEQTIALDPQRMATLRSFPLQDETGELFAWVKQVTLPQHPSFFSDSTVLEAVNDHLTRLCQHGDQAFLIVHREGWIHTWHPRLRSLLPSLGKIGQPMAGQIDAVTQLEVEIPQFSDCFYRACQGEFIETEGEFIHLPIDQTQKNGSCQLSYSPIFDGEGILQGVCVVFRMQDSFRLEPLQAESSQSSRYKGDNDEKPTLSPALTPSASPSSWLQAINRQLLDGESLEAIAPVVLENLRQGFHSDRVLLYQFQDDGNATVIFESVATPSLSLHGQSIQGSHFLRSHQSSTLWQGSVTTQPQIWVMDDPPQVSLTSCYAPNPVSLSFTDAPRTGMLRQRNLLQHLQVKSCLAIPLVFRRTPAVNREMGRGKWSLPWGWLVMHHCDEPRPWQTPEIDLLCAIASQLSSTLQQLQLSQQLTDLHDQLEVKVLEKTVELQTQVQELQQLNHLKDDFLSIVAHELRAPLANMNMAIKMLSLTIPNYSLEPTNFDGSEPKVSRSTKSPTYQRHHTYLDILQTECKRETDLINDLLDLQKLEANSFPIHPEVVNLNEWLPSIIEPFCSRIQQRHQVLKVEIPEHLSPIFTDASCLGRVLSELLNNACKYTPRQEEIIFQVQETSLNTAQATLRDRTTGNIRFILCNHANIPPEQLPRIFEKFYRVPHADIDKQGGTGLGLALVRQLVEQLEATLQVDSQAGWTTFTIDIPCHPSAPQLNNDCERLAG